MPRKRDLHPGLFTNEPLARAEFSTGLPLRTAYAGLWCHCDRNGAFKWEPGRLKLGILPWDGCDMGAVLDALVAAQFVVKYEVDGEWYGLVPTFAKRQNPHPKEAAHWPLPGSRKASGKQVARKRKATVEQPTSTANSLSPNSLSPNISSSSEDDLFAEAWAAYPQRPNNSRLKALAAWRARLAEGAAPALMVQGARAYAAYVKREGIQPRFVKLASTFFGPDRHWETDYGPCDVPAPAPYGPDGEMTAEAARYLGIAL